MNDPTDPRKEGGQQPDDGRRQRDEPNDDFGTHALPTMTRSAREAY